MTGRSRGVGYGNDFEVEVLEREGHQGGCPLTGIPTAPEGFTEPDAERAHASLPIDLQASVASDLASVVLACVRSNDVGGALFTLPFRLDSIDKVFRLPDRFVRIPRHVLGYFLDRVVARTDAAEPLKIYVDVVKSFEPESVSFELFWEQHRVAWSEFSSRAVLISQCVARRNSLPGIASRTFCSKNPYALVARSLTDELSSILAYSS